MKKRLKSVQLFSSTRASGQKLYKNKLGGPLWVIPLTIGIFIASQVAAGVLLGLFLALTQDATNIGEIFDSASAQFAYVLIAEAAAVGLVLWILKLKKDQPASIGLGRRPVWNDLWSGLAGFLAFYLVLIIVLAIASWLIPSLNLEQSQDVGFDKLNDNLDHFLAFVSLVLLAPAGEEVLMRGYLFSGLRARLKFVPAGLITSLIFAAAHLEFGNGGPLVWAAALSTFVLSLVLVYKREKTGAIYAGILIHVLNNSVAFLVNF